MKIIRAILAVVVLVGATIASNADIVPIGSFYLRVAGTAVDQILGIDWWENLCFTGLDYNYTGVAFVRQNLESVGVNHAYSIIVKYAYYDTDADKFYVAFSCKWKDRPPASIGTMLICSAEVSHNAAIITFPQQRGSPNAPMCVFDSSQFNLTVYDPLIVADVYTKELD